MFPPDLSAGKIGFPGIASQVSAFVTGKKHGAVKEDTGDLGA